MTKEEIDKREPSKRQAASGTTTQSPPPKAVSKQQKKEEVEQPPSPMEPFLEQFKKDVVDEVGVMAVEEAYVNRMGEHTPTLVIQKDKWLEVATLLRQKEALSFDYLRNLSAVDYETHMEVVYVLFSFSHLHQITVRVKLDRDDPAVHTVSHLWEAANWNERECYDLFGIVFLNHPNLKRILMPDSWVGFPLRKDYEPLDKEV